MVWVVDMPLVLVVVAVADATVPVVDLVPLMTALPIVEFCVLVHVPVTIAVVPRAVLVLLKVTVQLTGSTGLFSVPVVVTVCVLVPVLLPVPVNASPVWNCAACLGGADWDVPLKSPGCKVGDGPTPWNVHVKPAVAVPG
jgi:hypothetical protein